MSDQPRPVFAATLLLMPLVLGACSGGSSDSGSSRSPATGQANGQALDLANAQVSTLGFVDLTTTTYGIEAEREFLSNGTARFHQYDSPLTSKDLTDLMREIDQPLGCDVVEHIDVIEVDFGLDTEGGDDLSFVTSSESEVDGNGAATLPDSVIHLGTRIGAGQAITVMTPMGSWPDLLRQESPYYGIHYDMTVFPQYDELESEFGPLTTVKGPVPSGTTISVPGDEFPAFQNVPVTGVEPLTGLVIESEHLGVFRSDHAVTWDAGTDPEQRIRIEIFSVGSASDSFIDEHSGFYHTVHETVICHVPDNGRFEPPAEIHSLLDNEYFEIYREDIERVRSSYRIVDDALLLVRSSARYPYQY